MSATPTSVGRALAAGAAALLASTALAAPALLFPALLSPAAAAPAVETDEPAPAGAGWLARQLVDGTHLETEFDGTSYPDYGLTADAVLAFDAAGVAGDAAASATGYLAEHVADYTGAGEDRYAGPLAKLTLLAASRSADPTDFGGRDLVGELAALECGPDRPDCAEQEGRFADQSEFGDYSNIITQSLALLALERVVAEGPSAAAVDFLANAQCDGGGFPTFFPETPGDPDAACAADVDATGFAVQALLAAGADVPAGDALDWLVSTQRPDGSWRSADGVANANSTGVAAQALTFAGRDVGAALDWLADRQVGCAGKPAQRGAIAFTEEGFDPATAVRATTQAVPALAGGSLLEVSGAGAAGAAPRLKCTAEEEPTPTPTPTPTPSPSSSDGSGDARPAPELADSGADTPLLLTVGTGLLALGGALLLATRRGGARR